MTPPRTSSPTTSSRMTRLMAPMIALVAVAGLGLASLGGDDAAPSEDDATPPSPTATPDGTASDATGPPPTPRPLPDLARRQADDPRALGEVDAPVVMVEWSDFQCPFCGRFARDTEPALVDRYVEEGVLRIEWRDFPYLGPESTEAALAGRAAADQNAFWDFHDAVYADAREPNSGELGRGQLLAYAQDLGLDVAGFEATMDDPATAEAVQQEFREAQELGVTGTPSFLINGQPVMGAQPLDTFAQVIEMAAEDA